MSAIIDHIPLEDLPPHVISYLSGYPPSERVHIAKKLLAYAVSKLEQRSEKPQNPNRYQPPTWWGHEEYNKGNKKKNKKSSKLPFEDRFPKRMVDEMTQTSDAYVRPPEKMPKGTRGYKKLFAEPPRYKLLGNEAYKKSMSLELEKTTVISVSSSPELSNSDTIPSESEDDVINNIRNKDPFFVASTKKSTTNFLKNPQQTKELRYSPRIPPTPQTPTQIHIVKSSSNKTGNLSNKDRLRSTSALKHKWIVNLQSSASKSSLKGKGKAELIQAVAPCGHPKAKYKTTIEIADEFLESTFIAYFEPPPKEDDDLERIDDLEEIIYKARQKALKKDLCNVTVN